MPAQASEKTRYPGVFKIHVRGCGGGRRCNCGRRLRYQAAVWSAREGKRIRKHFPTEAAAKDWRSESAGAIRRGDMRSRTTTTVAEAAKALIAGMEDGSIRAASGALDKPSTTRSQPSSMPAISALAASSTVVVVGERIS